MKADSSMIRSILRDQALQRTLGAIREVRVTYYGDESKSCPLYKALRECEQLIKDNW